MPGAERRTPGPDGGAASDDADGSYRLHGAHASEHVQVALCDGTRLDVEVSGPASAPWLVLLQGQASAQSWWTKLRLRYSGRVRTVSMDYRGTGATAAPPGEWTTGLFADDMVAALDTLDIAEAHVYGTSMGGRVAQMLAARHPSRVVSLVLACTSPGGAHADEQFESVRRNLVGLSRAEQDQMLLRLFYTPQWGDDPTRSHLLGDPSMSTSDRARHRRLSAAHDAWDLLPGIDSPTLVLHGSDDAVAPPGNAERLAARLPQARLHIHPGGRHGFFDEFADNLEPVLDAFWTHHGA